MMDDSELEEAMESTVGSKGLVYWRLGKVEKAVETFNADAQRRDDLIVAKLDAVSILSTQITENSYKIKSLERTRDMTNKVMTGLIVAVGAVIADILFNIL